MYLVEMTTDEQKNRKINRMVAKVRKKQDIKGKKEADGEIIL